MVYRAPTPDCIPQYDLIHGEEWNPPEDVPLKKKEKALVNKTQGGTTQVVSKPPRKPIRVDTGRSMLKKNK